MKPTLPIGPTDKKMDDEVTRRVSSVVSATDVTGLAPAATQDSEAAEELGALMDTRAPRAVKPGAAKKGSKV